MSRATIVEEWDANPGEDPQEFMRRMSDGTWIYGTAGRSPGDYFPEQDYRADDAGAAQWFRERWGYIPGNAVNFFPGE